MDAVIILFLVLLGAHLFRMGTYYIEFDGKSYWVWQRAFLGYNKCRGLFDAERKALDCIEKLKRDPPRVIIP